MWRFVVFASLWAAAQCADGMDPDAAVAKARRVIERVGPVALITLDASGFPSARTVQPREVAPDLSNVRLGTRGDTRKVAELRSNPHVALNWQDQKGRGGWVTLKGVVTLEEVKPEVRIHVDVAALEAMDYNENLKLDAEGYKPAVLVRSRDAWAWPLAEPLQHEVQQDL